MNQLTITYLLMGINILVFFVTQNQPQVVQRMMLINGRVRFNKEYDRLFLAGFAHGGIGHLIFNMLTLYYFGPALEEAIGKTLFLLLFLGSIVGGNLYCMLMRKEDNHYAALGASGGVLGLIFAFILAAPDAKLYLFFVPIGIPGWIFGILFSISSIIFTQLPRGEEARISHEGHLGGALVGGLFMLGIMGVSFLNNQQLYFVIGGLAPIVLFALIKLLAPQFIYRHRR
ncbi:MAG: rhomboid family intramembrane serine protease [Bacteroidia bacterium]|nr:rhomboid family intramembrane serine protease [Bacteroidia bacterium]